MKFSLSAFVYTRVIDPILSGRQRSVIDSLNPSDRVLDIACGTGSLSLAMAGVASFVKGIDISEEMIGIAKETARKRAVSNIEFSIDDATDLSQFSANSFDVAVTSMSVHQFDPDLAVKILSEMQRIAGRVIIMDYYYPLQSGIYRMAAYFVEWIAGGQHYSNFKKYNKLGGLEYYTSQAGISGPGTDLYSGNMFMVRQFAALPTTGD